MKVSALLEDRMKVENKRVLAVGAHPDDVEFMCSGTLRLLQEREFEIFIGVLANGDCGSMVEPAESITRIRRHEALDAAKLLGAELYQLGELDLRISFDDRTKQKVTELVRMVDPAIVFTHPHEDYMADHEITSRLVRLACFAAPIPNFLTKTPTPSPRTYGIPHLYYWSPIDGLNRYGNFVPQQIYVDITSVIAFKTEMLSCHKSQRDWLLEQHGIDKYTELMKSTASRYGKECGFDSAEGFRQHRGNAYPRENLLKTILAEGVVEKTVKEEE
jgi:LmbE family N-acetylglucosaminyl deacetylase